MFENKQLTPLQYWVQKTLPLVYDDSLSYYELLNKVVLYLNDVIDSQNTTNENFEKLHQLFIELQSFVDTYFINLDVQNEINTKLDDLVADGTMDTIINQTIFGALNEEIDRNVLESNLRYEQTDFVDLLSRYAAFDLMQLQKLEDNLVDVTVFNQKKFLKFTFACYSGSYWVQSYVTSGDFTPYLQGGVIKRWADTTRTGTWVDATDTNSGYATEIGSTFEVEIVTENDGDGIMLALNANTSGGLWEVTVDNDHKQLISCV